MMSRMLPRRAALGALAAASLAAALGCDKEMPPAPVCTPGQVQDCYTGPPATLGVGACRRGSRVCNADGLAYGECVSQVVPQAETCGDVDLNCDGALPPSCAPAVLTTGGTPWFLATTPEDDSIFWTNRFGTGDVYKVKKDGTGQQRLYTSEADPRGLWVEPQGLFWVTNAGLRRGAKDGSSAASVFTLPAADSAAFKALLGDGCSSPFLQGVNADDSSFYVTTGSSSCTGLLRISRAGAATPLVTGVLTESVVRDGTTLFVGRPLTRVNTDGSGRMPLDAEAFIEGIAFDASAVYVQGNASIFKINKDGSGRQTLATFASCGAGHYAANLAISANRVFWLEQCSKTIRAVNKDGTSPQTLYTTTGDSLSILFERDSIYWSEVSGAGRIMKMRVTP